MLCNNKELYLRKFVLYLKQEGMKASDVASVNEFPDVCAVIQLMDPSASRASDDKYRVSFIYGSHLHIKTTFYNLPVHHNYLLWKFYDLYE